MTTDLWMMLAMRVSSTEFSYLTSRSSPAGLTSTVLQCNARSVTTGYAPFHLVRECWRLEAHWLFCLCISRGSSFESLTGFESVREFMRRTWTGPAEVLRICSLGLRKKSIEFLLTSMISFPSASSNVLTSLMPICKTA